MLPFLRRLFAGAKRKGAGPIKGQWEEHYEAKKAALERVLGRMHDTVGHSVIPFYLGGALDMYYFSNAVAGTACVTMELIEADGSGPKPCRLGTYELVAFTKHPPDHGPQSAFTAITNRFCDILTTVAKYAYEATLNPGETCELPADEGEEGPCLLLDEWQKPGVPFAIDGRRHGLLLCIEVFRSEMDYARANGSEELTRKLKERGHWPYSDLDRDPVV